MEYSYDQMYKLIKMYIKETLKSDKQINEYVPNTHIAQTFRDVLIYLELENIYPNEFHKQHLDNDILVDSNYHILDNLKYGEYFNKKIIKIK